VLAWLKGNGPPVSHVLINSMSKWTGSANLASFYAFFERWMKSGLGVNIDDVGPSGVTK